MKINKTIKILSVVLAVLLVTGGVIGVVYASAGSGNQPVQNDVATIDDTIKDTISINPDSISYDKEETVYIVGDANGNTQQIIVSDWLKNPNSSDTINDYTELSDITNTNGEETFSVDGEDNYIWNAAGSDIHYQGETQNQLPVTVGVTYLLDGEEISPADLAGKSGHVTIRFNYTNTQKVSVTIDGQSEDIYVPFLMVSGLILDGDSFSNVTVTNGSVYNDGSRSIVIGYALPDLSTSLDISEDDFDIPEYVEIEADTTDFSLSATLTIGLTNLFDNIEINSDSSIEDLTDSLSDLEDATLQLIDGASELSSGSSDFYDGCNDLNDGVSDLLDGAKDLDEKVGELNTQMSMFRDGLNDLSQNSESLDNGAKGIVDAIFASATTQLREKLVESGLMTQDQADEITLTPSEYVAVFQQLSSAATVTPEQVEAKLRSSLSAMTTDQQTLTLTIAYDLMSADSSLSYTDAVANAAALMVDAGTAQAACAVIDSTWLTDATHQAMIAQIMSAMGIDNTTAAKIVAIAYALDSSDPTSKFTEAATVLTHAATVSSTSPDTAKITALCTAVASAATSTGNASLDAVKTQLDDVMAFYNGLLSYTAGVDTAYTTSKAFADGTSKLKNEGTSELVSGVTDLYAGSKKLVSGADELNDGCLELKNGINEFYDEGIKKLVDALDVDYAGLLERLRAVADAGRSYQSFAGIADDMSGTVKFIYRTDAI